MRFLMNKKKKQIKLTHKWIGWMDGWIFKEIVYEMNEKKKLYSIDE